jgi:hypothetical protein
MTPEIRTTPEAQEPLSYTAQTSNAHPELVEGLPFLASQRVPPGKEQSFDKLRTSGFSTCDCAAVRRVPSVLIARALAAALASAADAASRVPGVGF